MGALSALDRTQMQLATQEPEYISVGLRATYTTLAIISIISTLFVFMTIFSNKKLRTHPSILIGLISLFECISCYHSLVYAVNPMEFIDYFGLHYLFNWTVFFRSTECNAFGKDCNEQAKLVLCNSNQTAGYTFFQMMSLSLNLFLCIDLILTLKEPFYPAKRRTKWYIFFSVFIAVLISFLGSRRLDGACGNTGDYENNDLALSSTFLAIALSVYIMTALFSIIFAARMLSRPGVSSEIKGMYFRKHVLYVIVFIIVWSFTLATAYYNLYHSGDTKSPQSVRYYEREPGQFEPGPVSQTNSIRRTTVEKVSFIASILTGFFMALIRLMEPYFMFLLRKTWKGWFGIVLDEKELSKEGKITDTVAAFLNSSLNIELVHVILKVITEYCTRTSIGEDWRKNVVQKSYFKEKATHKIREIEIKDPDKWAIDKAAMERDFPGENSAPKGGEEDVTIINEEIEVLEHAPKIFSFIRSMDNIN